MMNDGDSNEIQILSEIFENLPNPRKSCPILEGLVYSNERILRKKQAKMLLFLKSQKII